MFQLFHSKRKLNTYDGIAILSRAEFAIKNQLVARDDSDYRDFDAALATFAPLLNSLPTLKDYGRMSCAR